MYINVIAYPDVEDICFRFALIFAVAWHSAYLMSLVVFSKDFGIIHKKKRRVIGLFSKIMLSFTNLVLIIRIEITHKQN